MIKWSILIPSLPARRELRQRLLDVLEPQIEGYDDIEILILEDNRKREYGPKMQALVELAQGEYLSFIDDDDLVSEDYIEKLYPLMDGVDCVGMTGSITLDGESWVPVYYSLENRNWINRPPKYYKRGPQHLTPIKTNLVRQVPWEGGYGADFLWNKRILSKNILKTENICEGDPVYFYYAEGNNREGVWDD